MRVHESVLRTLADRTSTPAGLFRRGPRYVRAPDSVDVICEICGQQS
jgi:hypothetical protein